MYIVSSFILCDKALDDVQGSLGTEHQPSFLLADCRCNGTTHLLTFLSPHLPAVMDSMSSDGAKNKLFPRTWLLLGILLQQQEKRLRQRDGGIQPVYEVPSATAGTGAPRKSTMFRDHFGPLTKQSL